jgi:hypothetical protein
MLDSSALINRQISCTGNDLVRLKTRLSAGDFRDEDSLARCRTSIANLEQQLDTLKQQADQAAEREARYIPGFSND